MRFLITFIIVFMFGCGGAQKYPTPELAVKKEEVKPQIVTEEKPVVDPPAPAPEDVKKPEEKKPNAEN